MRIGNHWESLASGGESEESEGTEGSGKDGMGEEGGAMHEMVETLAVLGSGEREKVFHWCEEAMPKDISARRGEIWDFYISSGWLRGRLRRIKGR